MRRPWAGRPGMPASVAAALPGRSGERVLAWSPVGPRRFAVATNHHLYAVELTADAPAPGGSLAVQALPAGPGRAQLVLDRPWHLVDGATWDRESERFHLTWVDRAPAETWDLAGVDPAPTALLQAVRERVQASVVLTDDLDLGAGRAARVVARSNLATGELLTQAVLGPRVRSSDPGVAEALAAAVRRVREQVGLD